MKRFLFAVAAVALVASVGSAEEKVVVAPPVTAAPVIVGAPGTPVIEYGPTTAAPAQRRGLFGRLRTRGSSTTTMSSGGTVPMTTAPGTYTVPAPAPMPVVPAPMPMPGSKPTGGAMTMPNGTVVLTGGTMDPNVVTTASYSEPAAARRGLFGRMRSR